jgi:hypothetical protein
MIARWHHKVKQGNAKASAPPNWRELDTTNSDRRMEKRTGVEGFEPGT